LSQSKTLQPSPGNHGRIVGAKRRRRRVQLCACVSRNLLQAVTQEVIRRHAAGHDETLTSAELCRELADSGFAAICQNISTCMLKACTQVGCKLVVRDTRRHFADSLPNSRF
jgi:hypothetical protein